MLRRWKCARNSEAPAAAKNPRAGILRSVLSSVPEHAE